ncbi:hypothetical protein [Paraburkholderia aspalathi]|nr:hypothetical protein [Paraburkholderia aspalathi]
MHRLFWIQTNGSVPENNRVQFAVSESKIVSPSQFAYCARRFMQFPHHLKALVGDRGWRDRYEAGKGAAADVALGPGDVIVMDCTTAKFQIVDSIRRLPIGRPTLAIVIDQATTAVVGLAISVFGETANLYRTALFRACTSQKELMKRLGLPRDFFDYQASPNDVFVDRGPGNSNVFREPLVVEDGPDMGMLIAPIACGRAKGVVEGMINIIIRRLRGLPGGFTRERTERARDERRQAQSVANLTRQELLKYAYEAAAEHNEGLEFRAYTVQMRRDNVDPPSRGRIFNHAMSNRHGGEKVAYSELDLYTGLLPRLSPRAMQKAGVKHLDGWFTSPDYQSAYEAEISKSLGWTKKLPKIVPLQDPDDPTILYWKRGPGDIVVLHCSSTDRERWDNLHAEEVEFDLRAADQKTRIRDTRRKTFAGRVPGHVMDTLIQARTAIHAASGGARVQARAEERERETREALAASREKAVLVEANSETERRANNPNLQPEGNATSQSVDDKLIDQQVRLARELREKNLREGMDKFLGE